MERSIPAGRRNRDSRPPWRRGGSASYRGARRLAVVVVSPSSTRPHPSSRRRRAPVAPHVVVVVSPSSSPLTLRASAAPVHGLAPRPRLRAERVVVVEPRVVAAARHEPRGARVGTWRRRRSRRGRVAKPPRGAGVDIPSRRVAAPPRSVAWIFRGGRRAAATTWIFCGDFAECLRRGRGGAAIHRRNIHGAFAASPGRDLFEYAATAR